MNQDTIKLLDLVAQKTGYKVSVGQVKDITSYARMGAASQANPMHIIDVNEKYHKLGDYIVAVQCAMLLIKWANPEKIPSFVVRDDKMNFLIDKCSKHSDLSKLPAEQSRKFAKMISHGIMNQLQSQPMEMMAIAYCRQNCPELIDQCSLSRFFQKCPAASLQIDPNHENAVIHEHQFQVTHKLLLPACENSWY